MKISSISIFALAFVVSVATMFAADPPPWAYGFEGPPQAGAIRLPILESSRVAEPQFEDECQTPVARRWTDRRRRRISQTHHQEE